MKPTELVARSASTPKIGLFALLRGLLHVSGTGAPKISRGSDAPGHTSVLATLVSSCALIGALAFTAAPALAAAPEAPVTLSPAQSVTATTAILEGTLNPGASAKAGWYFAYSTELMCGIAAYRSPQPEEPEVVGAALLEKAHVSELQPDKTYTFCMVATNEAGEATPSANEGSFKTLAAPPEVPAGNESASVKASEATLSAWVNPNNQETTYAFEYSTKATGEKLEGTITTVKGATAIPKEEFGARAISVPTGAVLAAGTTYYYRVVATNEKAEKTEGEVESFTTVLTPSTDPPTAIAATTVTLNGHLTLDSVATQYSFEYKAGTECTGGSATATGEAGSGAVSVSEAAGVTGLTPDTLYTVCFVTSNAYGSGGSGAPVTFRTLPEATVSDVTSDSATLHAVLDPEGSSTTYRFQYGPSIAYGSETPEGEAGSGSSPTSVEAHLQGLGGATIYHYRVLATNAAHETFASADQIFTTQHAGNELGLPDGRQWELVTPPDKHGALFYGQNYAHLINVGGASFPFVAQASADGGAMVDLASQPTEAEPQGYAAEVSVLSTRGSSGWSSQVIAPPHAQATGPSIGEGTEYRLFSEDLSRGLVQQFGASTPLSPEASEATPYLRTNYLNGDVNEHCHSSCFQPLVTRADTREGVAYGEEKEDGGCEPYFTCGPKIVDSTPDLRHVVLDTRGIQLTSAPNEGESGFLYYEWSDGQLQPLYLLPKSEGGVGVPAKQESGPLGPLAPPDHQLSDNGSVFFSYNGHVYLHDFAKDESVRLDVADGVSEPTGGGAAFLYASSDGSEMFFTDSQQLTEAPGGGIYECKIAEVANSPTCELELTTLPSESFIGGSEDASYLYFVGAGERLIVEHYDGLNWTATEGPVVPQTTFSGFSQYDDSTFSPAHRISPNGRFLAFMSNDELTGYDNRDALSGQPDEEVYLYDAVSNRLVCASCNPTGARPVGTTFPVFALVAGAFGGQEPWVAADLPPWTRSISEQNQGIDNNQGELYQPRYLSDSGRLFFNSDEALVPQDVNGTQDVYEYEPAGVGSCTTGSVTFGERSDGCADLISSGSSPEESAFMDASETGGDVFFITESKLVSEDYDDALDVYDAHECTEAAPCFPAEPAVTPPCSTGDACKPAPTPQPEIYGASSSATFNGPGNLAPPPPAVVKKVTKKTVKCKKGFVKNKKGRCVKSKKRKKAKKATNDRRGK